MKKHQINTVPQLVKFIKQPSVSLSDALLIASESFPGVSTIVINEIGKSDEEQFSKSDIADLIRLQDAGKIPLNIWVLGTGE